MRQTTINVHLWPGDSLNIDHNITVNNDASRDVRIVGLRWELVFAEDVPAEIAEMLEQAAVAFAT